MARKFANIGKISQNILHNRFVLYFIFFLAIANLFMFIFSNDMKAIGAFFLAGLLTSFFSKNMVVIMVVSMVVANIIKIGSGSRDGFKGDGEDEEEEEKEGFREGDEEDNDDDDNFRDGDDEDDDED
jgi:hypothetical protein